MLNKLFRYDFRCLRRTVLPLLCGLPISALLLALCMILFIPSTDSVAGPAATLLGILGAFGMLGAFLLFIACISAPSLIAYFHFAKNMYFDEGYLTLTLPASEHEHLLSKFFASYLWMLISFVTAVLSAVIALFVIGISLPTDPTVTPMPSDPVAEKFFSTVLAMIPGYIVYALVYVAFELILGFTVITVGCLLMPKRKIVGILLSYLVTNWVVSLFTQTLTGLTTGVFLAASPVDTAPIFLPYLLSAVVAALGVGCYFLSHRLLKKKINLE